MYVRICTNICTKWCLSPEILFVFSSQRFRHFQWRCSRKNRYSQLTNQIQTLATDIQHRLNKGVLMVVIVWYLDLQLPVQSEPITTKFVSSKPAHDEVYSIQFYVQQCTKVCQWLTADRCFFPSTPVSSTNKTDRHDIAELLLKVVFLNTRTLTVTSIDWITTWASRETKTDGTLLSKNHHKSSIPTYGSLASKSCNQYRYYIHSLYHIQFNWFISW
jgi:hypothetical protein